MEFYGTIAILILVWFLFQIFTTAPIEAISFLVRLFFFVAEFIYFLFKYGLSEALKRATPPWRDD